MAMVVVVMVVVVVAALCIALECSSIYFIRESSHVGSDVQDISHSDSRFK